MAELAMLADRYSSSSSSSSSSSIGRLTLKVIIRPASSLAQDRESSPAETSVLPLCYAAMFVLVIVCPCLDQSWYKNHQCLNCL